ncbi:hypothetical protein Pmani_001107 [Petrolisthes manimaculis]|uniref:Uncharacterized protein n=1 Tax=Petrolisthes manimaculis TaxID=1843537 RepID=A0AAE1QL71_9EUCA|nr:hypothetical protein Pmani_001107 [Petrolisthes manimaculis]
MAEEEEEEEEEEQQHQHQHLNLINLWMLDEKSTAAASPGASNDPQCSYTLRTEGSHTTHPLFILTMKVTDSTRIKQEDIKFNI